MLLRLAKETRSADLEGLVRLARELRYEPRFLDAARTLVALEGQGAARPGDRARFEELACVTAVLDSADAPELVDRTPERRATVVQVGEAAFGGGSVAIAAGPCAVEDEARLLAIARSVRDAGATLLRAGAFKPRTSPHSFQGLGAEGLAMLRRARDEVGLAVVTEVLDPRDVELVAATADMLQIGSRSMGNTALLTEAARSGRPILLKRGAAASVREFLMAAEYVLAEGNPHVVLCERGIRGFDGTTRNVLDVGAIAHLCAATHLPVVADPSHAAGRRSLVPPLAAAGLAAGAAGLLVEVHPEPHEARSDGAQALSLEAFAELVRRARALVALDGRRLCAPSPAVPAGAGEGAR